MSDHRAIAAVVATLERVVQGAANEALGQAGVRLGPPKANLAEDALPLVNICLFRVQPNAAMRNAHLPSRSGAGDAMRQSALPVDLHFLLSFYGDAATFQPERLMGATMVALEHEPLFGAAAVADAVAAEAAALGDADLAATMRTLRIAPETHSLEDFSKLWSVFFQVPYALSASYVVSHVVLESAERVPGPLPVARPAIHAGPMAAVRLDRLGGGADARGPVGWGGALWIAGRGLGVAGLRLEIGGRDVPLERVEAEGTCALVMLAPGGFGGAVLPVGSHVVQAVLPGAAAHLAARSNPMAFVVQPAVVPVQPVVFSSGNAVLRAGVISVDFVPPVAAGQTVRLSLDARDAGATVRVVLEAEVAVLPAARLDFRFEGLRRARYLVRAEVDGIPSLVRLGEDAALPGFGEIIGPEVDLA